MPALISTPQTVGGITYNTAHFHPLNDGIEDGDCCITAMVQAAKEGRASYTGEDACVKARLAVIQRLHMINYLSLPPIIRTYLFKGTGISREPSSPNHYSIAISGTAYSDDTGTSHHVRIAVAYLIDHNYSGPRPREPEYLNNYFYPALQAADAAWARMQTSFVCIECEDSITPPHSGSVYLRRGQLDNNTPPNMCAGCFASQYVYSNVQGMYIVRDDAIEVSAVGWVTEEYASENFYMQEDGYYSAEQPSSRRLMEYSADPFHTFAWDTRNKPNALVFGVELEMEHINPSGANQQALVTALGGSRGKNFILKSDSSLNYGVELVTMPFTLAQHLDGSGVDWKAVLDSVKDIGRSGVATSSCGIHIHINKKALSALTIGKMLVFLNDPGLAPLITTIAQRPSSHYCTRSAKKMTDGSRSSESRYDIMNVSVRHPTCELRMFRGNLTVERMYKNLEFCHALVQYCRQSSMRTLTDWGAFSQWMIKNRGTYPNLVRFLIDQKTVGFRQLARDSRDGQVTIRDK